MITPAAGVQQKPRPEMPQRGRRFVEGGVKSCGGLQRRQTDWLLDRHWYRAGWAMGVPSQVSDVTTRRLNYYTNVCAYLIFLTCKRIRTLQIWFDFGFSDSQNPLSPSILEVSPIWPSTHTHTHTFLSTANGITHTHLYFTYCMNNTAVFGPDAVFWLSLTRPNTTSCALQTFNH